MSLVDRERQLLRIDVESNNIGVREIFLPCRKGLSKPHTDLKHLKRLIILEEIEKMPLIMLSIMVHIHLVGATLAENFFESHRMISGFGIGTMNLPPQALM